MSGGTERLRDALERIDAMIADDGETWDLSPKDKEALKLLREAALADSPVTDAQGDNGVRLRNSPVSRSAVQSTQDNPSIPESAAPAPSSEAAHNVNPATDRCVVCGRNAFNRHIEPVCKER